MLSAANTTFAALLSACAVLAQTPRPAAAPKPVDFEREVRPILSANCFQCHGPDASTRMANLRLDLQKNALEVRRRGAAVVPGKASASLVFQRITATDPARRMPPASAHKTLTPLQVDIIRSWIEGGAPWKEHWAFRAPVKPAPPAVRNAAWARTPIDRFILARLEAEGLPPAAAAGARTLIRRVALDLTGLPPKPAEIEAFLSDRAPNAYERMVDRYLASPHYGEHRARYWLDAARYADTHGLHIDNYREIWPYRDWVINAFNRNLPFDRFSTEQLAGDLLPEPTLEQRVATGFHRCNVTTHEAGIIEDEYAEIYAKDRADTTAAVWLGLTVGCATCHDHKFDPITQKDFYALGAFFRNTTQPVMDGNNPDTPPVIVVPREEDREKWASVNAKLKETAAALNASRANSGPDFERWLAGRSAAARKTPFPPEEELFRVDVAGLAAGARGAVVAAGPSDVPGRPALHFVEESIGLAVDDAPKLDAEKPFAIAITFFVPGKDQGLVIAAHQNPREKGRGWVIDAYSRQVGGRLIGDSGKSIEIRAVAAEQLKAGTWNHVVLSYDGSRQHTGLALFVNGRAVQTQGRGLGNAELRGEISVDTPLVMGRSLAKGAVADLRIFRRAVTEGEARMLARWPRAEAAFEKTTLDAEDRAALLEYFLLREHGPYRELAALQQDLDAEARGISRRGAVTHVMHERADSKPFAHVLYRGAYDQKRDRVEADTPSALPPLPASEPRNRMGLAHWLFAPENPLTARVTVNRMWQEIFGAGIVKTAEDFGSQAEPPSHPELLDWLAVDFRESGWDVKRFYKQVLMSAAYRQAALSTPAKLAKDPDNRLLSRGPRFRLDGETVRDYALAASGLLAPQIGGPSVKPYQPDGIWEAVAMDVSNTRFYKREGGENLYRRSMYTFWKRSAPPASMEIFNAPSRENCTVRRERTNTPLQALVTMNDVQFVEAARVLAERGMQSALVYDRQLDFVAARLLARPLTPAEKAVARKAYEGFRAHYADHPEDARKLLSAGEKKYDPSLDPARFAAMTMLTSQLMNLDEVLNK